MHHFATLTLRNSGIFFLASALTLYGCTIHSTTTNNHAPGENETTGGEAKPDKPKEDKPKPDKPKDEKPKPEKPASKPDKPKPDKPKEDKPAKPDKPKEDKPAKPDKPKEDKPVAKPEPKPDPKPEPLPERSKIVLPVRIALEAMKQQIDEIVPTTDAKDWAQVSKGESSPKVDLKYELWRDPIDIKMDGSTFQIAVPVRYAANIRAQAKNPITGDWFSLAKNETWGTKQEPQRLTAHFEVKLDVDDAWKVQAEIKLVKIEHGQPPTDKICRTVGIEVCVTKSSIADDVREEINEKLDKKLKKALEKVEGKSEKALGLRQRAEKVWSQVQAPQAVPGAKDLWLVVKPSAIGVGRIRQDGSDVRVDIAVEGKLSLESGPKPKVKPEPLPKITKVEGDPGFFVIAELRVSDDVLDKTIEQQLRGQTFTGKKNEKVQVVRASVTADDKNPRRITVKVMLGDKPEDELQLQGELYYDAKTQTLGVDDFDYAASANGVLGGKLAGFDHNAIKKLIASKARWDLSGETGALKKGISAALATSFQGQANIGGTLEKLEVRDFVYDKDAVEAKIIVGGQLEVVVTGK